MKLFSIVAGLLLPVALFAQNTTTTYSWETQQAKVLPNGDLEWAPHTFQFEKGTSIRYIDFENGDDTNDGLSSVSAWKHHPWDASAAGNSKLASGIQTYIFKRGVAYRGALVAKESGAEGNPVRLTSDPDWGTGDAAILGSVKITGGWNKANAEIAPNIPSPDKVWYRDVNGLENSTKVVCEITDSGIRRVLLARSPNYVNTPEEPMQKWWTFTKKEKSGSILALTDASNFNWTDVNALKGGDVWAIEDAIVMCTLWKQRITNYNPSTKTITVSDQNFGGKDCKYYVENTPYLLDSPGEYYYDKTTGRIFIWLEGDKDPNTTTIEIASKSNLISISGKSNIEISGLTFGFTTYDQVRYGTADGMPTIKLDNCSDITIRNCKFEFLNGAILANGSGKNLNISDNEMNFMDDFSILLNGPDNVAILRNKIFENGTRHLGRWYSSIPAIAGNLTVGEIAGNIIEHTWGNGLDFFWGKADGSNATIPFVRGLVHHNKVSHSLQGVNDYGGIESWQGGPVYTYDNISEDAQGWHYNWWIGHIMSLGYPFYFDGAFKQYVFNNIVKGTGWNRNSAAYFQTYGFYNMFVHNVAYNTASLTGSGDNGGGPDGQNYYLANVSDSTQLQFDHTTKVAGIPFESLGSNFFSGNTFQGTFVTNAPAERFVFSFGQFVDKLNSFDPDLGQVGFVTSRRVFANASAGDFRPTAESELVDRGVKFFAPFPLSRVVGEWNFCRHAADSTLIKGENFYFTDEFVHRQDYNNVPKNHLKAFGLSADSFVKGELEDFTEGALVFDGVQAYCSLDNNVTSQTTCNNVDMTTNSFIFEAYFKTEPTRTGGVLVSKYGTSGYGYQLDLDEAGEARLEILNNDKLVFSQSGATAVNDGKWHHVLVEIDRANSVATIFIDGVSANGRTTGSFPVEGVSLTNSSDFLVGKNIDGHYFSGTLDFLRVSKGTLADAKTSIGELYKWEFDGPFLHDFAGNLPIGKRDAGALEKGAKLCNLSVSENPVYFSLNGGSKTISVGAEKGFVVTRKSGTFFSYSTNSGSVAINVSSTTAPRSGALDILGCNETRTIKIIQETPSAIHVFLNNAIKVMPNPVSGQLLTISVPDELKPSRAVFMDLNGKIVERASLNSGNNLVIFRFPAGLYLVKILGSDVNYTTKIIVN